MALTDKQQVFVNEYLQCWNASEAARRAGYTEVSAGVTGFRLLKNANVSAEIDARVKALAMSANEVLMRISSHARADMTDFIDIPEDDAEAMPTLNLAKALRAGKGSLVKKFKLKDGDIEFELMDAQAALAMLVKIHGMGKETLELTGKDGADIPIRVVDYRNGLAQIAPGSDGDSQ